MILTNTEVVNFCNRLLQKKESYIAIDTEFVRERTYWPGLCLIQIATSEEAVIIDPLSQAIDLKPIFELMLNPSVLKVFHSGRQDLEIFFHLMGKIPTPIFDTQIAAMVAGFGESVSYDTLVKKFVGIALDKSHQYTDWAKRPLSDKQLAYALGDVVHLRTIYEKLTAELRQKKRLSWIDDEMNSLTNPRIYEIDPKIVWQKIKIPSSIKPRTLAVLQELAAWRENKAKELDFNRQRVLKDDTLIKIALKAPTAINELAELFPQLDPAWQVELCSCVQESLKRSPDMWPQIAKYQPPSTEVTLISDLLRIFLKGRAEELGVTTRIIASRDDIDSFAQGQDAPFLDGWRYQIFGKEAIALKEGKKSIALVEGRVVLLDV